MKNYSCSLAPLDGSLEPQCPGRRRYMVWLPSPQDRAGGLGKTDSKRSASPGAGS